MGTVAAVAALAATPMPSMAADDAPYDAQTVRNQARALAASPYKAPAGKLPESVAYLGYDDYRKIRFDPNQALWRNTGLPFQAQFFHRGWLFQDRVDMFEVQDGRARPIAYRPELFDFGSNARPPANTDLGFAGMRLHAPINRPDYFDEVAVFLGASYFRAVGRNLGYGLSSRGLSLNTADQGGEEFPAFRAIWLERPTAGTSSIVIAALIDSPSAAASMRITLRPGDDTVMDVELSLFPRVDLAQPGIATGTSMFLFDSNSRSGLDDWRRAVHDSDGLMMLTGRGEELWRPLSNPRTLQVSSFQDSSPRGFGLMQRKRLLSDFEDLEARYEKRPSLWVEPIGNWGDGVVQLIEIPTRQEIHDNIVAFWRPKDVLRAKSEHNFTYRLHWCADAPVRSQLARFRSSSSGALEKGRVFVIEATGGKLKDLPPDTALQVRAGTDRGTVQNAVATPIPERGGWRISFELLPGDAKQAELRATLMQGDTPLTETWVYRWTA
jgi:glucans biosynthesis protein